MTTLLVRPSDTTASTVCATASTVSANADLSRREVPLTMPVDEIGYWTAKWRADELESAAARGRGEIARFDSDDPSDAVRWLLSDD